MSKQKEGIFTLFTSTIARAMGRAWVFVVALIVLIGWGISGPMLGFSDTWQLIINTGTTIITFLMVFIIQNTQNRDNAAMQLKLDLLLKKHGINSHHILDAEDESDEKLEAAKIKAQKKD